MTAEKQVDRLFFWLEPMFCFHLIGFEPIAPIFFVAEASVLCFDQEDQKKCLFAVNTSNARLPLRTSFPEEKQIEENNATGLEQKIMSSRRRKRQQRKHLQSVIQGKILKCNSFLYLWRTELKRTQSYRWQPRTLQGPSMRYFMLMSITWKAAFSSQLIVASISVDIF